MDRGTESLILNNTKLVYHVIYKMKLAIDDDLISEGMIGLIRAAKNFDASKGIKFSTYATSYISGCIKTYLTLKASIIKPSRIEGQWTDHVERVSQEDMFSEIEAPDDNIESKLIVEDFLSKLTPRERIVAEGLMNEKTQKEIGEEIHVSQVHIFRMIRIIRYKYYSYNNQIRQD